MITDCNTLRCIILIVSISKPTATATTTATAKSFERNKNLYYMLWFHFIMFLVFSSYNHYMLLFEDKRVCHFELTASIRLLISYATKVCSRKILRNKNISSAQRTDSFCSCNFVLFSFLVHKYISSHSIYIGMIIYIHLFHVFFFIIDLVIVFRFSSYASLLHVYPNQNEKKWIKRGIRDKNCFHNKNWLIN